MSNLPHPGAGGKRIIDLRIPSGKPGKEGGKSLEAFCTALPADTLTLVTLPRIDKQGQASKWFKTLEACGVVIPVYAIERQQLPQWIEQRLSHQQQTTDPPALQFFADRVEGNLLAAHHEIQKLALLYPSGHLTLEQIKTAVLDVARYDAFQLADAMLASHDALRAGGHLFYTVEASDDDTQPHRLLPSGRYAHSIVHVASSATAAGLRVVAIARVKLREEAGRPVTGWLVTLYRP